jgi:hypothetical protein
VVNKPAWGGRTRPAVLTIAVLAVLSAPAFTGTASALPAGADRVEARLAVAMDAPASGRFDGNFSFFTYTLNTTTAGADEMRLWLAGPDGPGVRANLESTARAMFLDHFRSLFPGDALSSVSCLLDSSSLADEPGTDALHPPVVIRAQGAIAISPASFGLPASADLDALAPLLLADGVELHRTLPLGAGPGHSIDLAIECFPGALFNETGERALRLVLDNSEGALPATRTFNATLRGASPSPAGPDSILVAGRVDLPDLSNVRINGSVEFRRADLSGYWTPPAGMRNLTSVSGATLSELVRSGVLPGEQIYEYGVLPVQAALQERLASVLNVSLSFSPSWSTSGNLTCSVTASSLDRPLFGLSTALVQGALAAGAVYSFTIPVDIGWPVELEFLLPHGLRLDGLAKAASPSGRPRHLWSDADGRGNLSASLASDRAPVYDGDQVSISVLADFSDPVPDTWKLISEGSADVPVGVDVRLRLGVVAVPASISAYLPANLTLRYLTADLVRLLLSERVITSTEMDGLLGEVRPRLEAAMRSALGQAVRPNIRFVPETLEGYDLGTMDGSRPIELHAWASGERTKHVDLFKAVRASPGLAAITQDFSFRGVPGWNVTYRMRFSSGTELASVRHSGVKPSTGNEGGRDHFEVAFGTKGGSSNVTAVLEPSPGLLFRALGPVCAPALVLVVVGAALVFRRLRRRRRLRAAAALVDWDPPAR